MKYIAIFDVPDGYALGCAIAKIAIKGKEHYEPKDFKIAMRRLSRYRIKVWKCSNVSMPLREFFKI